MQMGEPTCGRMRVTYRDRRLMYSAALLGILGLFGQVKGAVLSARSASLSDVSAAVASAKDGDTVEVPAGTASWPATLTIAKAITLQGAGEDRTVILDDLPKNGSNVIIQASRGKFYRLTGFDFRSGDRATKSMKGCVLVVGTCKAVRIDHCRFNRVHNRCIFLRNAICGVIDHCTFITNTGGAITIFHDAWDGKSWGDGSWATPIEWGGPSAIYIEDNDFSSDNSTHLHGIMDEYAGARFVFRYNTVKNGVIASHGTGSTGRNRGVRQWEIYNNRFTFDPATSGNAMHLRGGTGVVFDNTVVGISEFLTLHTYRYHTAFPRWSGSDGTCNWDLNDDKIYTSGTAGNGSGIGRNGAGGKLVVPNAGWLANQWVAYTVRNLDGLSNIQPSNSKGAGPGPFFSAVVANTSDTILLEAGSQQPNKIFAPGDHFEIRKVRQSLDMIGASTGDLLSGKAPTPRWLNQQIEPVYIWNNNFDGRANAGVATAPDTPIKEGVHFINNKTKPGYKPFRYPHPLVSEGFSSTGVAK
jgi:hypothetical protein